MSSVHAAQKGEERRSEKGSTQAAEVVHTVPFCVSANEMKRRRVGVVVVVVVVVVLFIPAAPKFVNPRGRPWSF